MKIALHICSYNGRNYKKRFIFLKKIVKNYFLIDKKIKIFIHTNKITEKFKIKKVNYIKHNLHNTNPFYLSWKCRELIKKQRNHAKVYYRRKAKQKIPGKIWSIVLLPVFIFQTKQNLLQTTKFNDLTDFHT